MQQRNLQTKKFLPSWTTARFAVLDASNRWAVAVHRELNQQVEASKALKHCIPAFESCTRARDVLLCCELRNTVGVILFAESLERDCLSIMGGLMRRGLSLPVLMVCNEHHSALTPVLLESGVHTILYGVRNDVPISDWCVRVLQQREI